MINGLCHDFKEKSKAGLKKIFADMLLSPVMQSDCTNARYNGKIAYVYICAVPGGPALYFAREHKGHEGIRGTVVEDYQGILVHDHDKTFYSYGSGHQECNAHILRYLKDSMDNEPDLTWNREMHSLMKEIIHYRNNLSDDVPVDDATVAEYERRYDEILEKAEREYRKSPPTKYYPDGYNLAVRMKEYKEAHLLFLHDHRIPGDNNLSERLLRCYKRRQAQAMSFRSFTTIEDICDSMSMLYLLRQNGEENVFSKVSQMFGSMISPVTAD